MINIDRLDHLVLTVRDIESTCDFYNRVLGMQVVIFGERRKALAFGQQKINLHQIGEEFEPKANKPTPGSADLCLIVQEPLSDIEQYLRFCGVEIISGPIERTGAMGAIASLYINDPDLNLIELSVYL
ncbi:glyoxalase/bleomycin resistance protein/dioxygenase [Calothrix sp. NIES-4101]|nr:glyoxalase/bleomycin resistance protein/dioxygenase [Calothrix sp. NIES-4101]